MEAYTTKRCWIMFVNQSEIGPHLERFIKIGSKPMPVIDLDFYLMTYKGTHKKKFPNCKIVIIISSKTVNPPKQLFF